MKQILIILGVVVSFIATSCSNQKLNEPNVTVIETNKGTDGSEMQIALFKGREFNHPTFAIWTEDMEGNFIETLYVTKYLGTGIYGHGSLGDNKWDNKPGRAERPSTLPYWLHKNGNGNGKLPTPEKPVPDAITAATPTGDFVLKTNSNYKGPNKIRVLMEINQPWDWNEFWHNGKFADDLNYRASSQPAMVYAVTVDLNKKGVEYFLNPIGHSHYAGKDGELYTDLSTLTTAKEIVYKVSVSLK